LFLDTDESTKKGDVMKHTYFSNRSGHLEHRYDCEECKNIQWRKDFKDKVLWVIAIGIIFIVVSGCSKLEFDPKASVIKYTFQKGKK
jgi:hypothetical protein